MIRDAAVASADTSSAMQPLNGNVKPNYGFDLTQGMVRSISRNSTVTVPRLKRKKETPQVLLEARQLPVAAPPAAAPAAPAVTATLPVIPAAATLPRTSALVPAATLPAAPGAGVPSTSASLPPSASVPLVSSIILPISSSLPITFFTQIATGTSINTFGTVTTTGIQIVPTQGSSAVQPTPKTSNFPIAAQVVVGVVLGLIGLFLAYRLYVWSYRRAERNNTIPLPEARPLADRNGSGGGSDFVTGGGSRGTSIMGSGMSMSYIGNNASRTSFYEGGQRKQSMTIDSSGNNWGGQSISSASGLNEKEFDFTGDFSPPMSTTWNGSNGSRSGSPLPTLPSRNSISTVRTGRSVYGPNQTYNGPTLRSGASSNRFTGAPHTQMNRIEIVPPLPLGAAPGSVVLTDKHTIGFSAVSGIGSSGGEEESWFTEEQKRLSIQNFPPGAYSTISSNNSYNSSSRPSRRGEREMQENYQNSRPTYSDSDSPTTTSSSSSLAPPLTPKKKRVPVPRVGGGGEGEGLNRNSPLDQLQKQVGAELSRN